MRHCNCLAVHPVVLPEGTYVKSEGRLISFKRERDPRCPDVSLVKRLPEPVGWGAYVISFTGVFLSVALMLYLLYKVYKLYILFRRRENVYN